MAVKRRNQKKREREELMQKAVKIKCCYCDLFTTCPHAKNKVKSEEMGIVTYCTMTPNRPKSFIKQNKKKSSKP